MEKEKQHRMRRGAYWSSHAEEERLEETVKKEGHDQN